MILHKVFSNNTYTDHVGINIICFYINSLIFFYQKCILQARLFLLQITDQREKMYSFLYYQY